MGLKIETIIKALEANRGFVTHAAAALNVTPQAIYKRMKTSERLKDALETITNQNLDLAESKLFEKINAGDLGAICFYLKCRGKKRGYIEKVNIGHGNIDDKPLKTGIQWID